MATHIAYIGIGSNVGDGEANCRRALVLLERAEGVRIHACSAFYRTEPVGVRSAQWFTNGAAALKTDLSPYPLLQLLLATEMQMGRVRRYAGAPRTIDLDLLFYDDVVMEGPELVIPHPRLQERRFVLVPLCEIAPDHVHPVLKMTVTQMLALCPDRSVVHSLCQGDNGPEAE